MKNTNPTFTKSIVKAGIIGLVFLGAPYPKDKTWVIKKTD